MLGQFRQVETPPTEPKPPHAPGDTFSREALGHLPTARSFLEQYLPPDLARQIDWNTLRRDPESYLDTLLRDKYADLVFQVTLSGQEVSICVLLEIKTKPDHWACLYLLEVMIRIWRRQASDQEHGHRRLTPILPMILHQGPKGWNYSSRFQDYFEWPAGSGEAAARYGVSFEHVLVDLSRVPFEAIKGNARLRLILSVLKMVRENRVQGEIERLIRLLFEVEQSEDMARFLQVLAEYLIQSEEPITASTIERLAASFPEDGRAKLMTIAEQLKAFGREEGREEGLAKGREEGERRGMVMGQIVNCREILGMSALQKNHFERAELEALERELRELKEAVARMLRP